MRNGKGNHSKNGNNSIPVSIVKNWLDKTEKILWAIEEKQDESEKRRREENAENKKLMEKMDRRIGQNEQTLVELKEANREQKFLNSIFGREILKSHGYTNEQIDKMLSPRK